MRTISVFCLGIAMLSCVDAVDIVVKPPEDSNAMDTEIGNTIPGWGESTDSFEGNAINATDPPKENTTADALVGEWFRRNTNEIYEFYENGAFSWAGNSWNGLSRNSVTGRWDLVGRELTIVAELKGENGLISNGRKYMIAIIDDVLYFDVFARWSGQGEGFEGEWYILKADLEEAEKNMLVERSQRMTVSVMGGMCDIVVYDEIEEGNKVRPLSAQNSRIPLRCDGDVGFWPGSEDAKVFETFWGTMPQASESVPFGVKLAPQIISAFHITREDADSRAFRRRSIVK